MHWLYCGKNNPTIGTKGTIMGVDIATSSTIDFYAFLIGRLQIRQQGSIDTSKS
jgi:hypothetical protein